MVFLENSFNCIDCLSGFEALAANSIDHVFTSPPYNRKRNDKYNFYNDVQVDYENFISAVIEQSLRVCREFVFLNIQKNYYNKHEVFKLIGKYSKYIVDIIIWTKTNPMPASGFNVTNSYEFIIVLQKGCKPLKSNRTYTKNHIETNVYSSNPFKSVHRAVMHPELALKVLGDFTKEGQLILDPFMGIGTTAFACIELGRKFVGFELSEEYCQISKERFPVFN